MNKPYTAVRKEMKDRLGKYHPESTNWMQGEHLRSGRRMHEENGMRIYLKRYFMGVSRIKCLDTCMVHHMSTEGVIFINGFFEYIDRTHALRLIRQFLWITS